MANVIKTEDEIITFFKEEQLSNDAIPIVTTEGGIKISVSEEQL